MRFFVVVLCLALLAATAHSVVRDPAGEFDSPQLYFFTKLESLEHARRVHSGSSERFIESTNARYFSLDVETLERHFVDVVARTRRWSGEPHSVKLQLPTPDGSSIAVSELRESGAMSAGLRERLPEIRSLVGRSSSGADVRLDLGPQGLRAYVSASESHPRYAVDPVYKDNRRLVAVHTREQIVTTAGETAEGTGHSGCDAHDAHAPLSELSHALERQRESRRNDGSQLRTFRFAVAGRGEYVDYFGGAVEAMAATVATVNQMNEVYEASLSVTFELIANNLDIMYVNAATDPYAGGSTSILQGENQANIDSVIGAANYDISQVWDAATSGRAAISSVCESGRKASATSAGSPPTGISFLDLLAHETGHQFGMNHMFNGQLGNCGSARSATSAYEPGAGNSILGYAGNCLGDNIGSEFWGFHLYSLVEADNCLTSDTCGQCGTLTATGNAEPSVSVVSPSGVTIPISTPFALEADATDADGDRVYFSWEQGDLGAQATIAAGDLGSGPLFRSYLETTERTRFVPALDALSAGTVLGETLYTQSRTSVWYISARDKKGAYDYASYSFDVTASAGPFTINAPVSGSSFGQGDSVSVQWSVANTNIAPVSCSSVDIWYSNTGGRSYRYLLLAGTANDGSTTVTLNAPATDQARIMVRCATNIFFATSDVFNVNPQTTDTLSYTALPTPEPIQYECYYDEDFEEGGATPAGWSLGSAWAIDGSAAAGTSGEYSVSAGILDGQTTSQLVSPVWDLTHVTNARVSFWQRFDLADDGAGTCYNGGVLFSAGAGASGFWSERSFLTGPAMSSVLSPASNYPGYAAWCGTLQIWQLTTIDISADDGVSYQMLFGLATDGSAPSATGGWWLDDFKLCTGDLPDEPTPMPTPLQRESVYFGDNVRFVSLGGGFEATCGRESGWIDFCSFYDVTTLATQSWPASDSLAIFHNGAPVHWQAATNAYVCGGYHLCSSPILAAVSAESVPGSAMRFGSLYFDASGSVWACGGKPLCPAETAAPTPHPTPQPTPRPTPSPAPITSYWSYPFDDAVSNGDLLHSYFSSLGAADDFYYVDDTSRVYSGVASAGITIPANNQQQRLAKLEGVAQDFSGIIPDDGGSTTITWWYWLEGQSSIGGGYCDEMLVTPMLRYGGGTSYSFQNNFNYDATAPPTTSPGGNPMSTIGAVPGFCVSTYGWSQATLTVSNSQMQGSPWIFAWWIGTSDFASQVRFNIDQLEIPA